MEPLPVGHLVLSRTKHAFQQHVMMPIWKRLHPLYLRLAGAALAALVCGQEVLP